MIEKVEITRRVAYGIAPVRFPYSGMHSTRPEINEVHVYKLRYGDDCCEVVEDGHMQEMRLTMTIDKYNSYIAARLTNEMLNFIGKNIRQAVEQQAAKNAPKSDNMAYLFGDK